MKKLFLGSVALVAMLGGPAAFAADMPARPLPPPVPVANWTGCYVGLFIGTNSGKAKVDRYANSSGQFAGEDANYNLSGMLGGANIGCDYQVGAWVFGVVGDWAVTNKDGQGFDAITVVPAGVPGVAAGTSLIDQTHERWIATARARLGWAVTDKWLWYVTGGGAWISAQQSKWVTGAPQFAAIGTNTLSGWTAGLGTEYMLGYGWSITSEFLYVDVGRKQYFGPGGNGTFPGSTLATYPGEDVRIKDYILKFGMNYRFGWGNVARY
jgi:outer membrane immunogenic protein